jgi:hypothetical protein
MLKLADTVKINDNGLIGEICDISDGYCYIDVDTDKLNGIEPEFMDCLFHRRIEDVTFIKSVE